ncbi:MULTISPECIES: DNA-directed RNA polymerase subunit omega [Reichenbachiella]|uniref:RNA polymerase Rpb6 n=1 Tax=Reichenbachiella agariperforans TaxID=156994 RepID=A0A1M6M546_REIAG|nr:MULTISPECIES: DNA-directed RNA polymerase subunit omega [Reichenbachiella]MBU2914507.1 DNA-directed RNA polymerase subunit omega [Reichenbachiella agariperforans]RJE73925.1 DNA-directed RNA polymerase subunit omega [Reichenbachiella sp. MSK19-1]SHJ78557.1 RNA polymerase Rpb6 [Reichenbachiella agariperforans]
MAINPSIETRNVAQLSEDTGNVYKSIAIISKRARQISANVKEELSGKLAEFASTVDNLEEIFENREQIEISKFYERMPKPSKVAIEEFIEKKILARDAEVEEGGINV